MGHGARGSGFGGGSRLASRRRLAVPAALCALIVACAPGVRSQGVVELLQRQRIEARVAEIAADLGPDVAVRAPRRLGEADPYSDAFLAVEARRQAARDSVAAAQAAQNRLDSLAGRPDRLVWAKVEPDAQGAFLARYREVFWRASDPRRLALDTTATPLIRGRLQGVFGRPTRNADALRQVGYTGNEFVQFEYWFVVNDSIPVLLLDLDGPFGRGLLLAGSEEFADVLPVLKANLSDRLFAATGPDPFVDYYHSFERRQWYRTGYNGTEFFTVPIRAPGWVQSRAVDRWVIHR